MAAAAPRRCPARAGTLAPAYRDRLAALPRWQFSRFGAHCLGGILANMRSQAAKDRLAVASRPPATTVPDSQAI